MSDLSAHLMRRPMAPDRHVPLTGDDHDELFRLFDEAGLPPAAMSAEMADGYLTALVIGPDPVPAHEWLADVLGRDTLPLCADAVEQDRLIDLLLRRYRDVSDAMRLPGAEVTIDNVFFPLTSEVPEAERIHPYVLDGEGRRKGNWRCKHWADGFRRAMFADEGWNTLLYDKEHAPLLGPVIVLQTGFNPERPEMQIDDERDLFALLAISIPSIHGFWRAWLRRQSMAAATHVRETPKIGRNDPCPCGSGKKYKKCCGATGPA